MFVPLKKLAEKLSLQLTEDRRKKLVLSAVFIIPLCYGIYRLSTSFLYVFGYQCIPGDVSLIAISIIGLYCTRGKRYQCAVNSLFLVVFPVYFYFISPDYAFMPAHQTVRFNLWALLVSLLILFFFSKSRLKFLAFYALGTACLIFHSYVAGQLNQLLFVFPENGTPLLNPLLGFNLVFLIGFSSVSVLELKYRELSEKSEQLVHLISQTARQLPMGILVLKTNRDERGNKVSTEITRTNHAFESLFKIGARELRNADANLIFPKVFRDSFDWNNFFNFPKKNRTEFYVGHLGKWIELTTLNPAKDLTLCLFHDVTTKQTVIESLKESSKRYKVLLEAIPDLFFVIDKDGIYVDFVIKDTESLQINPDDIIGNSIFEVGFSERMARKIFQFIQNAIRFDSIETIEYALEVDKGTAMFEMRIAKLDDNSVISIARDITRRKMAEIQLEEAKQKAEEADQLKSAFLANISHEIRTPMNAIIGFSQMIGSPDFDMEEKNRFIDIVVSNGKLLMEMINDMISISKIESKQVVMYKSFVKINDLLVDLYREYSLDLSNKAVRLRLNAENTNPRFGVSTDRHLLNEIIKKLIDNAIKFTHEGEVEFGYQMQGKNRLLFFVKDTGIGIEQQHLSRIFDRFHQIDNKTTRKYEGTGLGLAIAQHYAITLGGKIEVESEMDKGSKFSFSIPFEKGEGTLSIVR
ncbi:MAG: sensor histidine kinase [Mangrovibacterium sp.]